MKFLIRVYKYADARYNHAVFYDYVGRKGDIMARSANVIKYAKAKGYNRKCDCTRLINKLKRMNEGKGDFSYEIVAFKA